MSFPADYLFPSDTLYPSETPASGVLTSGVVSSLSPWNDAAGAWQAWNTAYAAMFEPIAELVLDVGSPDEPESYTPGFSILIDPDNCPARYLPFCGQFLGVFVAPGTPEAEARALIKAHAGFAAGTPAGIVSTAQRFLTGSQSCLLVERTGLEGADAYAALLIMRPEQVTNQAALENAVLSVKPAGVVINFVYTDGTTWVTETHTWASDTSTWAQKG